MRVDTEHDETGAPGNGDSTPVERNELGAQLRQEQQQREEFVAALTERDDRIDELTSLLSQVRDEMSQKQEAAENTWMEMTALREEKVEAVTACREALRLAHPGLPPDLISGETVQDLNASVDAAKALVDQVRAALNAEREAARVPAGAPVNPGLDMEGLSSRDKIAAGVRNESR